MAIITLDSALAGFRPREEILKVGTVAEAAGTMHSLFYAPGRPGAAATPAGGINGLALTSYAGQLPMPGAFNNTHLAGLEACSTVSGKLMLIDRLWQNSGIAVTTTTAQGITTPTWPARDVDGATAGNGIMVAIEVSTATTNAGAITNTTLNYTDEAGNAAATGTNSVPITALLGTFLPFSLATGDKGIRSIQGITLGTSYGGGAIHLVAYRLIASLPVLTANIPTSLDLVSLGMPRIYDNSVLSLVWVPTSTAAPTIHGSILYTQG